jgi:hypothetical protein
MNIRGSINKSNIINCILALTVQQQLSDIVKRQENRIKQLENK